MTAGGRGSREAILNGPIAATLFGVAWPTTASLLLEQGQNFVVALWAGRLIGGESLTALAVMNPVLTLLATLTGVIHIGLQIVVARATGRGTREAALVANGFYLGLTWSTAIALLGLWQLGTLVRALAGDLAIVSSLEAYFTPWLLFYAASVLGGAVMFAVSATGWTRFGMWRSVASIGLMFVLMPVLIAVFDLGLAGVSLSDGLADLLLLVLAALALYSSRGAHDLAPRGDDWRIDFGAWRAIIAAGLPYQLVRGIMLLLQIAMIRVLMTTGAGDLIAGYGIVVLVLSIIGGMIGGSIISAAGIVIGQNVAAGNVSRATAYLRVAAGWLGAVGIAIVVLLPIFGEPVYGIFTDNTSTIDYARSVMKLIVWAFPAQLLTGLMLRANAAIVRNRVANFVSMGCTAIALIAVLTLPGDPLHRIAVVTVCNAYVQMAALSVLVLRSLRAAAR